jgi:hypothetical protein
VGPPTPAAAAEVGGATRGILSRVQASSDALATVAENTTSANNMETRLGIIPPLNRSGEVILL